MANTNEYLVYGWSVQQNGATAGQSGYSQPGNAPAAGAAGALEASSGNGFSPAGTGAYGSNPVLSSPGYASSPALIIPGQLTPPTVPTNGNGTANNPSGLEAQVTITGGTLTAVKVAAAGSSTYTQVGTGAGVYQVPGGGSIQLTGSVAPTWTWVAVN